MQANQRDNLQTIPQPDGTAQPRQIARLRLAFALTLAQAALVATLAYGEADE